MTSRATALGSAALLCSMACLAGDLLETFQGGFSTAQLLLALLAAVAMAAIVVGLALVQRPGIGLIGEAGALAYAFGSLSSVIALVFALIRPSSDSASLLSQLPRFVWLSGALMVVGALAFGWDTWRAAVLPRWSGAALAAGVVMVTLTTPAPAAGQLPGALLRDGALAWMGWSVLRASAGKAPSISSVFHRWAAPSAGLASIHGTGQGAFAKQIHEER